MKRGITINSAEYIDGYKIKITFSDGKVNIFDYESIVMNDHEESIPYRDIKKFKKFNIINENTDIAWGENWDMILPIHTLYTKTKIAHAGRKPKADKKVLLRLYIPQSIVDSNGGIKATQIKATNFLNHKTEKQ